MPPLAKAVIETFDYPKYVKVTSSCKTQNTSYGLLAHKPEQASGLATYKGSTRPGFSGSPYIIGNRVVGMHVGGGSYGNYGFTASYIDMVIKTAYRPQSSELEMIQRMLGTARVKDFEFERGLDETRLRVGGRYVVLDNDEFDELYQDEKFDRFFYEEEASARTKLRRRWNDNKIPEYEPERADDESVFSLNPPVLNEPGEAQPTTSLDPGASSIPCLEENVLKPTDGPEAMIGQFVNPLQYAPMPELEPSQQCLSPVLMSLSQQLEVLTQQIRFLSDAQSSLEKKVSTITTGTSSKVSRKRPPSDSEISRAIQQLEMRWDGMDYALQTLVTWHYSNQSSAKEYKASRDQLMKELSLTGLKGKVAIQFLTQMISRASVTP
uniref:Serine protease n=1 Tax=Riboviria sp. TaxID=2585031 RepID=A0A8K1U2K2_9VIRU|nr:MAG: hypothetical protein 2 [Riboviria sp.]